MKALCALILGLFLVTVGNACTSDAQRTAAQDLAETVTEATRDGIVTTAEAELISQKMIAYVDAPGVDWAALGGTVLASIAATFLGLRWAPNSVIIGKEEAAAVNKAAGI